MLTIKKFNAPECMEQDPPGNTLVLESGFTYSAKQSDDSALPTSIIREHATKEFKFYHKSEIDSDISYTIILTGKGIDDISKKATKEFTVTFKCRCLSFLDKTLEPVSQIYG